MAPTPVIALNRAVAIAMADGPERGLRLVDALEDDLGGSHLFHAARADLLRRLDRTVDAAAAYRRAVELSTNATEHAYLERRLAELAER
jgi:RNA polymerase sigma-70 factor (ECF subfamily)